MKKLVALSILFPCLAIAAGPAQQETEENTTGFFEGAKYKAKVTYENFGLKSDEYRAYPGQAKYDADLSNILLAGQVDFESGYISDMFGANVTGYGIQVLDAGDNYFGKKYFKPVAYGEDAEGFLSLREYHLKQKFNVSDTDIYLTQGVRILRDFGVLDREAAAIESSYQGVTAEVKNGGLDFKFAAVDGLLNSNSDKVRGFRSNQNASTFLRDEPDSDIDYILTGDVSYQFGLNKLRYKVGHSDDYLTKQGINYDRYFDGGKLQVYGLMNTAHDGYKSMDGEYRRIEDNAYHFGTELNFFFPKSFVKLAYTYTDADRDEDYGLGQFELGMSAKTVTNPGFAKGDARYYTWDGQHMVGLIGIHEISEGFKLGFVARYATGAEYQGADLNAGEWAFLGLFDVNKNVNIELVAGKDYGWYQDFNGKPILDSDGEAQDAGGKVFITRVSYTF